MSDSNYISPEEHALMNTVAPLCGAELDRILFTQKVTMEDFFQTLEVVSTSEEDLYSRLRLLFDTLGRFRQLSFSPEDIQELKFWFQERLPWLEGFSEMMQMNPHEIPIQEIPPEDSDEETFFFWYESCKDYAFLLDVLPAESLFLRDLLVQRIVQHRHFCHHLPEKVKEKVQTDLESLQYLNLDTVLPKSTSSLRGLLH